MSLTSQTYLFIIIIKIFPNESYVTEESLLQFQNTDTVE